MIDEICEIFAGLGFTRARGPEAETELTRQDLTRAGLEQAITAPATAVTAVRPPAAAAAKISSSASLRL